MEIGKIAGSVWATRKSEGLDGRKLLLVRGWDLLKNAPLPGPCRVAADLVGAGIGERVLLARGGAARLALSDPAAPVDWAVVAILDGWEAP